MNPTDMNPTDMNPTDPTEPPWSLEGYDDQGDEFRIEIPAGESRVGSSRHGDIRLRMSGISREHALLITSADGVIVEDLGSTNGTFVDGHRIRRSLVQPGSSIAFGPVEVRLVEPGGSKDALAIQFAPPTSSKGDLSSVPDEASTMLLRDPPRNPKDRTPLLEDFIEQLPAPDNEDLRPALAVLAQQLELDVAVISWLDGRPVVVANHGALGDVPAFHTALEQRGNEQTCWVTFFDTEPALTAAFLSAQQNSLVGLLLWGDFEHRSTAAPWLRSAIRLLARCLQQISDDSNHSTIRKATQLRFPDGYQPGPSPAMRTLFDEMKVLLRGDLPVIISGETGVGKEQIARTLYLSSDRHRQPFVAINCAALPKELLEAEMFGIKKGVATGVDARKGRFLEAHGGVLFLDEVGEMPPELQAKLLRVLQEKEVTPVGGQPQSVDVRVLAATNVDLSRNVADGSLRPDLFYRLAGYVLQVPALRSCRPDISGLVAHFLESALSQRGISAHGVTVQAIRLLTAYEWPGNVRELEHEMRRLAMACKPGAVIDTQHLSPTIRRTDPAPADSLPQGGSLELAPRLEAIEREMICEALRRTRGRQIHAAKLLGLSRNGLAKKVRRLGIDPFEAR